MDVNTGFTVDPNNMYRYISSFFTNPNVYVIVFAVILIVIFIFMGLLGSSSYTETSNFDSSSSTSSTLMSIIKLLIGIIFIVFFILFIYGLSPDTSGIYLIFSILALQQIYIIHFLKIQSLILMFNKILDHQTQLQIQNLLFHLKNHKFSIYQETIMVMRKQQHYVKHMTRVLQNMMKSKNLIMKEENGVIMDGLMDKWRYSLHKQKHIKIYKRYLVTKTTAVDQALMVVILLIQMCDSVSIATVKNQK